MSPKGIAVVSARLCDAACTEGAADGAVCGECASQASVSEGLAWGLAGSRHIVIFAFEGIL